MEARARARARAQDLEACVWLEETLKKYRRILLMVSHSQARAPSAGARAAPLYALVVPRAERVEVPACAYVHMHTRACCSQRVITRRANTPQRVSTPSRAVVPGGDAQDFMNGVATNIIHLQHKKLRYYGGAGPARALAAWPSGGVPASALIACLQRGRRRCRSPHCVIDLRPGAWQATMTAMCGRAPSWRRTR